jgi:hypothetical protein
MVLILELKKEKHIQQRRMKYLKNNFMILVALFFATATFSQNIKEMSNLKDFQGMWKFVPPEGSNDTTFIGIQLIFSNRNIDLTYWKDSRECTVIGILTIGFADDYTEIKKLSDLKQ